MRCRTNVWVALAAVVIAAIIDAPLAAADGPKEDRRGALFVMTNSAASDRGNEVVMYERDRDGNLTLIGFFPTGRLESGQPQRGAGPSPTSTVFGAPIPATADGLGSSNSLILGRGNHCLFAVNAGSNTVSSFQVHPHGLELASIFSSQGDLEARFPVSLTESRNILYVLNAGDRGSLTGFRVRGNCTLVPLAQSSRDLRDLTNSFATPAPGEVLTTPAQASFTPDGQRFVLSVKGGPDGGPFPSGRMAVFPVDNDGLLGVPVVTQFSVAEKRGGPFSFTFVDAQTIIVVHANSQTVASYTIDADNSLTLLSGTLRYRGLCPLLARWHRSFCVHGQLWGDSGPGHFPGWGRHPERFPGQTEWHPGAILGHWRVLSCSGARALWQPRHRRACRGTLSVLSPTPAWHGG